LITVTPSGTDPTACTLLLIHYQYLLNRSWVHIARQNLGLAVYMTNLEAFQIHSI